MKRNTFLKIAKDVVGTLLVLIPAIILSIYMAGSQLADLSGIVLMVVSGIVGLIDVYKRQEQHIPSDSYPATVAVFISLPGTQLPETASEMCIRDRTTPLRKRSLRISMTL